MFSSGMKESSLNEIEIKECSYDRFLDIMNFIYTDDVIITNDSCVELLELSNYYKLDRLKALCEIRLRDDVDIENAANVLGLADRFAAKQLYR